MLVSLASLKPVTLIFRNMDKPLSPQDVFGGESFLDQLCTELDELYPKLNPTPTDDVRSIMYRAGQRSVVEFILSKKSYV